MQAADVVPVHPPEGGQFDVLDGLPWTSTGRPVDQFGVGRAWPRSWSPRWSVRAGSSSSSAAPLLGVLFSMHWQRDRPTVRIHSSAARQYFFESEQARLTVWVSPDAAVTLGVSAVAGMDVEIVHDEADHPANRHTVALSAPRWGRYAVRAHVEVLAAGGLLRGTATVAVADCCVFPIAPPHDTGLPTTEFPAASAPTSPATPGPASNSPTSAPPCPVINSAR